MRCGYMATCGLLVVSLLPSCTRTVEQPVPGEPPDDISFGDDTGPAGGQFQRPKHGEGK
jgi:hypothetical protein